MGAYSWEIPYDVPNCRLIGNWALNDTTLGRVTTLGAIKDARWKQSVFVKPTNDLKAFAGMVIEAGETIAERLAQATQDSSLSDEQPVLWAPRQDIECEFRCYMHKTDLIASCRYRTGLKADHKLTTPEEHERLRDFVSWVYAPARFYAVDVAMMPDGTLRVVEYNCINCSGRYEIDRGKLFTAMMDD